MPISRIVVLVLVLSAGLLCSRVRGAEEAVLRVGVEQDSYPFSFKSPLGQQTGFDVEFAQAVCKNMDVACTFIPMPFAKLLASTRDGELDFAVAGMAATEERRRYLLFTDIYYRSHSIYIGRAEFQDHLERLEDKRIGVKSRTLQAQYLLSYWGEKAHLVSDFNTMEELVNALKADKVDAIFVDGFVGYAFLKSREGKSFRLLSDPFLPVPKSSGSRIAVTNSRSDLVPRINEAIRELRRDGTSSKLSRKYFSFDIY